MAAEAIILSIIEKLKSWLEEATVHHPKLRLKLQQVTEDLSHYLYFLKESKQGDSEQYKHLEISLLPSIYKVEDMADTLLLLRQQRQKGHFSRMTPLLVCLNPELNHVLQMKELNYIKDAIKVIDIVSPRASFRADLPSGWWGRNSDHYFDEMEFRIIGRHGDIGTLTTLLTHSEIEDSIDRLIISVVGDGGSGKTALVKTVYETAEVRQLFDFCFWIYVSKDFDPKKILVSIYNNITGVRVGKNLSYKELKKKVNEILGTKKYLIVMDDVWTPSVWDKLKTAFPNSKNGSRIIFTTCNEDIASYVDPNSKRPPLKLSSLSDEESWILFLQAAARIAEDSSTSSELDDLKHRILRSCSGLPLAVILFGGMLSTKEQSEWQEVIELASSCPKNQSNLSHILALSYQDLPSPLKLCFLYMGIFPRAIEIPIRRLYRLWLAEGWVTPLEKGQKDKDAEILVEAYFEELIRRNMVEVLGRRLDGSPKTCRMPGFLYDFFLQKAVGMGLFHIHHNTDKSITLPQFNIRRLAEYLDIGSFSSLDRDIQSLQSLRSFVSFNTRKQDTPAQELGKFLDKIILRRGGFGLLRVLDLEGVYKPLLPESMGKLLHLRYLGLRWTFLDSLPDSVGDLPYLETLDMKHTNISTLPSSIWKAKKLRHLYMNEIHLDTSLKVPSNEPLSNLQTLWGLFLGDKDPMMNGLDQLIGLRKLGVTFYSTSRQAMAQWISLLTNLQSLRLRSIDEFNQPSDLELNSMAEQENLSDLYLLGVLTRPINVKELPPKLRILTLSVSRLEIDPMPLLGQLPCLSILRLFARSYLGEEMICYSSGFPRLRVLKLWMLEELQNWVIEEGAMPCLRKLEIRCCMKLKKPNGLQRMADLKELILTNMEPEFVADIKEIMAGKVFITVNNWEFSPPRDQIVKDTLTA